MISTASALAASQQGPADATFPVAFAMTFTHYMNAATTVSTTFKVRAGQTAAGSTTFNGGNQSGTRAFGGVMASSITITELKDAS